jgi:hypothetical protein
MALREKLLIDWLELPEIMKGSREVSAAMVDGIIPKKKSKPLSAPTLTSTVLTKTLPLGLLTVRAATTNAQPINIQVREVSSNISVQLGVTHQPGDQEQAYMTLTLM